MSLSGCVCVLFVVEFVFTAANVIRPRDVIRSSDVIDDAEVTSPEAGHVAPFRATRIRGNMVDIINYQPISRHDNDPLVKIYNQLSRRYITMTSRDDDDVTVTLEDHVGCAASSCSFEHVFLCQLAPQFFHACPLPEQFRPRADRPARLQWIYSVALYRSLAHPQHFLCLDRRGHIIAKRLNVSSRADVLSCAFYAVPHHTTSRTGRHTSSVASTLIYNFRYPLQSARCRQDELRRHGSSVASRRNSCQKWFVGTRSRLSASVTVVKGNTASAGANNFIDNGPLAAYY